MRMTHSCPAWIGRSENTTPLSVRRVLLSTADRFPPLSSTFLLFKPSSKLNSIVYKSASHHTSLKTANLLNALLIVNNWTRMDAKKKTSSVHLSKSRAYNTMVTSKERRAWRQAGFFAQLVLDQERIGTPLHKDLQKGITKYDRTLISFPLIDWLIDWERERERENLVWVECKRGVFVGSDCIRSVCTPVLLPGVGHGAARSSAVHRCGCCHDPGTEAARKK